MPDAWNFKGASSSTAPRPYVTGKTFNEQAQAALAKHDPQTAVDAYDAARAAGPEQEYGGPEHVQGSIRAYQRDKLDRLRALEKKWGLSTGF